MQSPAADQTILGYVLRERIGSGGYGEVWSAEAPGGISKAIKFIFGVHDESRAQIELKSLDKIKEARHPFLLSLDRIDVVDNRVVVISELADESLAEIFDRYREHGEDGVPRDELLRYLRDAADGLDYISDAFSLQHLDIKPENLLIVSGHVKVADFGLVKSIHNVTQSMMTGLTPTYAPPELFDGKPSKFSDQYSLAIVYQEMLTGIRPFRGTTPAQLAAQHVHGHPDLSPLSRGDQIVVKKALAKDPNSRFAHCNELIEELLNRKSGRKSSRPEILKRIDNNEATMQINVNGIDVTNELSSSKLPVRKQSLSYSPPLELGDITAKCRPTLVLGLGNSGTQVVSQLRRLLNERIGVHRDLPSLQLLAVDTDRKTLSRAVGSIDGNALHSNEALEIPLRPSQEYREKARQYSNWLSRRWIYNVPRSLQTEGLRPLGRLAFADHSETIFSKLHQVVSEMVSPENLAATAESLQMVPESTPRIILISSISGGIGSGCVLDFAYATRTIFSDLGIRNHGVDGFLMHATSRMVGDPQLNTANTFACLTELSHFVRYGYPGDESLGIPEFEDALPFDNTYVLDLGNNIRKKRFDSSIQELAEYMFLDVASHSQAFFEASRRPDPKQENEFGLRTVGFRAEGIEKLKPLADELLHRLLKSWTSSDRESSHIDEFLETVAEQFFDYDRDMGAWSALISEHVHETNPGLLEKLTQTTKGEKAEERFTRIVETLKAIFEQEEQPYFVDWLTKKMQPPFKEVCTFIEENCQRLINLPEIRVGGILQIAKRLGSDVQQALAKMESLANLSDETRDEHLAQIRQILGSKSTPADLETAIAAMVEWYARQATNEALRPLYRKCLSLLSRVDSELQSKRRTILLWARFSESPESQRSQVSSLDPDSESAPNFHDALTSDLSEQFPKLTEKLDLISQKNMFQNVGGFNEAMEADLIGTRNIGSELEQIAGNLIAHTVQQSDVNKAISQINEDSNDLFNWIGSLLEEAKPEIDDCGGNAQVLVALPQQQPGPLESLGMIESDLGVEPNVIKSTHGKLAVCVEAQGIEMARYAFKLLSDHPECVDLVERIQTRTDIDWINLAKLIS